MNNPSTHKSLKNPDMDDLYHALGRPVDPLMESYRNRYFAPDVMIDELTASPFWHRFDDTNYFEVSAAGRKALDGYLASISDPTRVWEVRLNDHDGSYVSSYAADSREQAVHHAIASLQDSGYLSVSEFIRHTEIRQSGSKNPRLDPSAENAAWRGVETLEAQLYELIEAAEEIEGTEEEIRHLKSFLDDGSVLRAVWSCSPLGGVVTRSDLLRLPVSIAETVDNLIQKVVDAGLLDEVSFLAAESEEIPSP